ncbi:MAG: acetoacetyl-CoA reductase [Gammaproteobacteria bacterium]|nr:acetoacetyl-CoA reductase [Gammaproteobacteria bacterium]
MKNHVVLVTGGAGGIGTAICQHFCRKETRVIATYHRNGDHDSARTWQAEQRKLGFDIAIKYVDVTDFTLCEQLVKEIESEYGAIDILVNNAGITRDVSLSKMKLEQWQDVLKTNLDGIFNITRHAINGMINRHYGRIINISSINGQKGQRGQSNYAASKAGIHGFTKSLAQEVANRGITVNTVSPGYIETEMVMSVPEPIREKIINEIPVGRLGRPAEVARVVVFLASQESSFITGSNITINGGQYLL